LNNELGGGFCFIGLMLQEYNFWTMNEYRASAKQLFDIELSDSQQAAFQIYENELIDWNSQHNLTAIDDPNQIKVKHFLDSLSCLLAMKNTPTESIIDIGTGAGFPGLPLKILDPRIHLTLVESVGKKAAFCEYICQVLGLNDVEIIRDRAEAVGHQPRFREQTDWAVARAVAALPVLVEYLLPLIHVGGHALAMKGENAHAEAQAAQQGITLLGGELEHIIPVNLPGIKDERYLVVIKKISPTPDRFPRRVGIPSKRPLGVN
jgi:16S rRNA (guanine527-N7)-methyltransferase